MAIKLVSEILNFWKFWKSEEVCFKNAFFISQETSGANEKPEHIWKNTCCLICVQTLKSLSWKKLSFIVLKGHLLRYWWGFRRFSNCYFFQLIRFRSVLASFFSFLTKIRSRNMYHTTQTQNFEFDLFVLVTLDGLQLTQGHKRLRGYLEVPQTRRAITCNMCEVRASIKISFISAFLYQFLKQTCRIRPDVGNGMRH